MLLWVYRGPRAGEFIEVDEVTGKHAVHDGWAVEAGMDSRTMPMPERGEHPAAEEYLKDPRAYATREMRAAPLGKASPVKEKLKKG